MQTAGLRRELNVRWQGLKDERSSWLPVWRDIADYICPDRGRFDSPGEHKGDRRDELIIDDSARLSHRNFASGMRSGLTNPANPWFKLVTPGDPEKSDAPEIRAWLDHVGSVLMRIFNKSNSYAAFQSTYAECGAFGTHAFLIEHDYDTVVRVRPFTAGEYVLGTDGKNRVSVMGREFSMTALQMVTEYGADKVSHSVKEAYHRGNARQRFNIIQLILPNEWREEGRADNKNMPYLSAHWDPADQTDRFLRISGYKYFPAIAPRWSVVSDDVYSKGSPGWFALGNAKMIQQLQADSLTAIQKVIDPPVQAPSNLVNQYGVTTVPGGINYVPDTDRGGIRSIYDGRPDIEAIEAKIQRVGVSVERAFFSDLFLMLNSIDRNSMTATEVAERHEEKLLMLGPVLEQLYNEMLDPVIDIVFQHAFDADILPPAPPDLEGEEVKAEYVSVLAQAQRMVGTAAIEQTMAFAGGLLAAFPEVRHKIDAMAALQKYGTYVGVPAEILRPTEEALYRMEMEAQQIQEQQAMEAINQGAQSAQLLADTPVGETTALDTLLGGLAGGVAP